MPIDYDNMLRYTTPFRCPECGEHTFQTDTRPSSPSALLDADCTNCAHALTHSRKRRSWRKWQPSHRLRSSHDGEGPERQGGGIALDRWHPASTRKEGSYAIFPLGPDSSLESATPVHLGSGSLRANLAHVPALENAPLGSVLTRGSLEPDLFSAVRHLGRKGTAGRKTIPSSYSFCRVVWWT